MLCKHAHLEFSFSYFIIFSFEEAFFVELNTFVIELDACIV